MQGFNRTVRPELRKDGEGAAVVDHDKARLHRHDEDGTVVPFRSEVPPEQLAITTAITAVTAQLFPEVPRDSALFGRLRDLVNRAAITVITRPVPGAIGLAEAYVGTLAGLETVGEVEDALAPVVEALLAATAAA
jgi:hypothetical protein